MGCSKWTGCKPAVYVNVVALEPHASADQPCNLEGDIQCRLGLVAAHTGYLPYAHAVHEMSGPR